MASVAMKRIAALLFGVALSAPPALAGDCDALTAAWVKGLYVPHKSSVVVTRSPAPNLRVDDIWIGGKLYLKVPRYQGWTVIDQPADKAEALYRKAIADQQETCRPDGSEVIGGETFDITATHRKVKDGDRDGRAWISRSTGLVLEEEATYSAGFKGLTIYDYNNVVAPANAVPPSPAPPSPIPPSPMPPSP
jgi:hypothetical protein